MFHKTITGDHSSDAPRGLESSAPQHTPRHWPRASELGPEVACERRELQHARALLVRVDVNVLDLLDVYQELKDSWKQQSLQARRGR